MATQRQKAANLRNAQKSTGPKTKAGKEKVKFNAVDHGLRSDFDVIPGESAEQWAKEQEMWNQAFHVQDIATMRLAEKAARASWRLARVYRAENAHFAKISAEAAEKFDRKQRRLVGVALTSLHKNAPTAREAFNVNSETLNALAREWQALHDVTDNLNDWNHHRQLCRLLDNTVQVWNPTADQMKQWSDTISNTLMAALLRPVTPEQVAETNLQGDKLRRALAECVANCVTLRDQYIPTAQLRGYVVDSAMLKPRPEGDVLLKYEAAAECSLNNALKEYKALAKLELDLACDLDDTDSQTAPTPEPTPAEPPTPAKPELVPPAPLETNKPNLDITLIKPEPYKNPLSDEDRYQTSVKLEFTSEGTYTAYCEAMLEKAAAKIKEPKTYDTSQPDSDTAGGEPGQVDRDRDGRTWPPRD